MATHHIHYMNENNGKEINIITLITHMPPEVIAHIGSYIDNEDDIKSTFLCAKCFAALKHNDREITLLLSAGVMPQQETILVVRKRQPHLKLVKLVCNSDQWDETHIEYTHFILKTLSQWYGVHLTFDIWITEVVNICDMFADIDTSTVDITIDASTITLRHDDIKRIDNITFHSMRLIIDVSLIHAFSDFVAKSDYIFMTHDTSAEAHTVDIQRYIEKGCTRVFIYSENPSICVKPSMHIDGIMIANMSFASPSVQRDVYDFYNLHRRIFIQELVVGNIDIGASKQLHEFPLFNMLEYIQANTYIFDVGVHPFMISLLRWVHTRFRVAYNNIRLLAVTMDKCIVARLCQLLVSPSITICIPYTKHDNLRDLRYTTFPFLHFSRALAHRWDQVESVLMSNDISWLLESLETESHKYAWDILRSCYDRAQHVNL